VSVVPVDLLKFPEFKSMGDHHSEIIMIDYIFRWVIAERRLGTITLYMVSKYGPVTKSLP
jgi:hypothetical protein